MDYSQLINMNGRQTLPEEPRVDGPARIALLRNQSAPFFNVSGLVPGKSYKLQVCSILITPIIQSFIQYIFIVYL